MIEPGDDKTPALQRPIESRADFVAAVHDTVSLALAGATRRMVWVDADFAEWPLNEPALLQALTNWVRLPQRQLVLLAADYDDLRRRHARFTAWVRLWSHASPASARRGTRSPSCHACCWPKVPAWCICWTRCNGAAGPPRMCFSNMSGVSGLMHSYNDRRPPSRSRPWVYREIH